MKRHATSRKDDRRKSAEWTGFFATTTATAIASTRTANTTKAQPAPPVRSTPPETTPSVTFAASSLFDDREGLDVRRLAPVGQLADVEIEGVVAVIRRHLVGLGRQPDGLGSRRARLLAELAEHAALQVHVEAVQHLDRLPLRVLLVVPVDVDDVDRAFDRAEGTLDTPLFVQTEHPAETVRGDLLLLRVLDRQLLLEEVASRDREALEEIEKRQLVQPFLQRHRRLSFRMPSGTRPVPPPAGRAGSAPAAAWPAETSPRRSGRRSRRASRDRSCARV